MFQIFKSAKISPTATVKSLKTILRKYTSFQEKGLAEENIYMMRQQHEELLRLRKRILEDAKKLNEKIQETDKFIKKMENVDRMAKIKKAVKDK